MSGFNGGAVAPIQVANNLTTTSVGYALDARQGKELNDGKVNKSDIINNLTSTATDKPLSAAQGKALNDFAQQSTTQNLSPYSNRVTPSQTDIPRVRKTGKIVSIGGVFTVNADLTSSQTTVMILPSDCVPPFNMYFTVERESDRVCFPGQVATTGNLNIIHAGALRANDVIYFGFTYSL